MTDNQTVRLSPKQYKAILEGKGWTYKELAAYWGFTRAWLSRIVSNPLRARHFDDALMGLPSKTNLERGLKSRLRIADGFIHSGKASKERRKPQIGGTYASAFNVGTIISASDDIGSLATQGMRGLVFQVTQSDLNIESMGVIFENGLFDWFTPFYIDKYLVQTGLEDSNALNYRFISDTELTSDFNQDAFNFYP